MEGEEGHFRNTHKPTCHKQRREKKRGRKERNTLTHTTPHRGDKDGGMDDVEDRRGAHAHIHTHTHTYCSSHLPSYVCACPLSSPSFRVWCVCSPQPTAQTTMKSHTQHTHTHTHTHTHHTPRKEERRQEA